MRTPLDVAVLRREQLVRALLNPARDVGVGGTAVRRVVLEPAVLGRVVRGRDDDPVGEVRACARGSSTRIAREMTGVGVTPLSRWMIVSTPLPASTSSAVSCDSADSACVSLPM